MPRPVPQHQALSAALPPPLVRAPSRRHGGPLTFALGTRIAITVVVGLVGVGGMLFFMMPYFTSGSRVALAYTSVFIGPFGTVAWLILRDVWKRAWRPVEVLTSDPAPPATPPGSFE